MKDTDLRTDQQLVALYANGDNAAFETLLMRHKDKLYSYIDNLTHSADLSDDIFQETFVKIIMSIRQRRYTDGGKFLSWAARIAHNLIIDHFRREEYENTISHDGTSYDLLNNAKLCEGSAFDHMAYEETLNEIRGLLHYLPLSQRRVVVMRFYRNKSYKEIAETLSISINTALGRMRYALNNLRRLAEEQHLAADLEKMI